MHLFSACMSVTARFDVGSDYISSWSLLIFSFWTIIYAFNLVSISEQKNSIIISSNSSIVYFQIWWSEVYVSLAWKSTKMNKLHEFHNLHE